MKKLPRWPLVLGIMIATNLLTNNLKNDIVEMKENRISELKEEIKEHKLVIDVQVLENKTLKSRLSESYEEITKPDGTKIKRHIKEVMKEQHEIKQARLKLNYEFKIKNLNLQIKELKSKKEVTTRALSLSVGYKTDLSYFVTGQYDVWGPVGLSLITDSNAFGVGIGIRF